MPVNSKAEVTANLTTVAKQFPDMALNEANFSLLKDFINLHCGGDWTVHNLTAAVLELWPKLDKEAPAPPPTPSAELQEQLEPWQIPLNPAPTSCALSKASKKAVTDYLKRARPAAGINYEVLPRHAKSQENF